MPPAASCSSAGVFVGTGFEWNSGEYLTIRPVVSTNAGFENFDFEDIGDEVKFETHFIWRWSSEFFTTFWIGSDFDETQLALGFTVRVAGW